MNSNMTQICQPNQQRTGEIIQMQFLHKSPEDGDSLFSQGRKTRWCTYLSSKIKQCCSKFLYWQHYSFPSVKEQAGSQVWRQGCWPAGKQKYLSPEPEPTSTLPVCSGLELAEAIFQSLNPLPTRALQPRPENLWMLPYVAGGDVRMWLRILKRDDYPELSKCIFDIHLIRTQLLIRGTGGTRVRGRKTSGDRSLS